MYAEILKYISSVKNDCLRKLLEMFFIEDPAFIDAFKKSSAASPSIMDLWAACWSILWA
jgi:3'-5' exoribonuclease